MIKMNHSPASNAGPTSPLTYQTTLSSAYRRDRMQESRMRLYDQEITAPSGLDSPGDKYSCQWGFEQESRIKRSKQYSIPKEKRELKFNSANG